MSRTGIWAIIGAVLAVVIFGAGAWFFASGGSKEPWNRAGDPTKFVDECYVDLSKRGALAAGNTAAQVKSACRCFADGFYPLLQGKSQEEAAAYSKQSEALEKLRALRKKCAYQVGLDGIDEWWN